MAYARIVATYKVITPMYLGSSSPSIPATRLREASFKGALRFWWRALMWHKAYQQAGGNEDEARKTLRRWEAELFGTASDSGAGNSHASPFRLRCEIIDSAKGNKDTLEGNGWKYLKGQGLAKREAAFAPGAKITANLLLPRALPEGRVDELLKALVALGLFGGIGARSRRGVGSVAIQKLQIDGKNEGVIPQTPDQLKQALEWLDVTEADCPLPPLAAFSRESRVDWVDMNINDFGCAFMNWRGYYEQLDCKDEKAKPVKKKRPNFEDDHDIVLKAVNGNIVSNAPRRAVFGLPHNYFYKSVYDKLRGAELQKKEARKKASANVNYESAFKKNASKKHERHASPFLVHAHDFDSRKIIMETLLPNKFLEEILSIRGKRISNVPFSPDWKIVHDFMNEIDGMTIL